MNGVLTETDPRTGKKTLSPVYALLHSRRKAEIRKDEPEQKSIETKLEVITQIPEPKSTITASQQQALIDLQRYKAGGQIDMSYHVSQVETKPEPQPLSFEEKIISDWKNDPALQKEFTSFNAYAAYQRGVREGRIKTHEAGKVIK